MGSSVAGVGKGSAFKTIPGALVTTVDNMSTEVSRIPSPVFKIPSESKPALN